MFPANSAEDIFIFADESGPTDSSEPVASGQAPWHILIVDDDPEIHSVTKLALSGFTFRDRSLRFTDAHSGTEAIEKLKQHHDVAVVLLDVVMEADDAGLKVVRKIRDQLGLHDLRIILRTGQPGYAPEESIVRDYDINDYKTKTELTRSKLVTTLIAALRSYEQIRLTHEQNLGLEHVLSASALVMEENTVEDFAAQVIKQIGVLLNCEANGLMVAQEFAANKPVNIVLGGSEQYAEFAGKLLPQIDDGRAINLCQTALNQQKWLESEHEIVLYFTGSSFASVIYFELVAPISVQMLPLLKLFVSNVAVGAENLKLFQKLRNVAYRDAVTGLINRNEFINQLDQFKASVYPDHVVTLLDIQHFSDVNDGLGQEVGNALLLAVATKLQEQFPNTRLARVGADVFGLIGPASELSAERIFHVFEQPFRAEEHLLPVNCCLGVCKVEDAVGLGTHVLTQAYIALNMAKKDPKVDVVVYQPQMEEQTTWRLGTVRRLRQDFAANKLEVWLQPQVDIASQRVIGAEALLRWPTGDGHYIPPFTFIPLAEYSGLIIDIGLWVLDQVCQVSKQIAARGLPEIRLAVNVSMPQFRQVDFVERVLNTCRSHGVAPESIELEITESVVMDEPKVVIDALTRLKQHGFTIAIDDFGTGFSSLSYLQQMPLDRLKVDRAFIKDTPDTPSPIAEVVIALAQKLGLTTIAEGIESAEQLAYMKSLGCDEGQGYLFAKPMPLKEFLEFIQQKTSG